MARRSRSSTFEDITEIVATFPWWVGVVLAAITYLWLHGVATRLPLVSLADMKDIGANVGRQIWTTLAMFGQYIIPVACLMGAALSAHRRAIRHRLHQQVARAPTKRTLESITWRELEALVGEVFLRRGFAVEERGGSGPDGGIDLVLRLGTDIYLVQCKQWKARLVGVATVRELFGVMAAEHAAGGFVVASGGFTDEARRFVEGRSIELIGTDQILAMIKDITPQNSSVFRRHKTDALRHFCSGSEKSATRP